MEERGGKSFSLDLEPLVEKAFGQFKARESINIDGQTEFYNTYHASKHVIAELITKNFKPEEIFFALTRQTSINPHITFEDLKEDYESWDNFYTEASETILRQELEEQHPEFEGIEEEREERLRRNQN